MKQRAKVYIFTGMFLGMTILPGLLFVPLKEYVDMENYENRIYQERPVLNFRNLRMVNLKSYPGQYDTYFNDHLTFKNPIMAFRKLADTYVFGEVTSDAVLMGKDEWMFYKLKGEMEDSIANCQGTNRYSEEDSERFTALFRQANENPASGGMKLVFYMVLNREQVYSEFMPSSMRMVQEQSKADLLYVCLKENTDYDVHYPLDKSKEIKGDQCQIYRKCNIRWNDMRASMASQMVIQDIDGEPFGPESYRLYDIESRGTFSGGLATMLNLQKYYDDDPFLRVSSHRENMSFEMDYQNEHKIITHCPSDAEGKAEKILTCRDSSEIHMAEYFARDYLDVMLMDYRTEDCGIAALELRPDAMVIEAAERYTDYMFGPLERLGTIGYGMELAGG